MILQTDGAKKEQKKAFKEIKTTIHNTGSRLAAAGTATASRQQSKKTHTEKVGESRNPNPTKKTTNAQKESKRYLKKELDTKDLQKLSYNEGRIFADDISKSINAWFPSLSANGSTKQEVPIGENIKVYYELIASKGLAGGKNGEIALIAKQQKLLFDSFTASTGMTQLNFTTNKDGSVSIKGENKFGNNQASLNIVLNRRLGRISAEYEVTSEVEKKGKVTTILGMEKDMSNDKFESLDFEVMTAEEKAKFVAAVLLAVAVGIISDGTIPTEAALNEILLSDGDLEQFLDENISRGDMKA